MTKAADDGSCNNDDDVAKRQTEERTIVLASFAQMTADGFIHSGV